MDSDIIAIDGTNIRAQNSKKNNYNLKKIKQHLKHIDAQTKNYLDQLNQLDEQESAEEESILAIAQKLDHLATRQAKYNQLNTELEAVRQNNQAQISTTDPDARALPKRMNIVEVSYNVQSVVESQHKLITHFEVTNENDRYALSKLAIATQQILGKDNLKVLADKGYDTGAQLKECAQHKLSTYVAPRKRISSQKDPRFGKNKFEYDLDSNTYLCPQGETLKTNGQWYNKLSKKDQQHRKNYRFQRYEAAVNICRSCPFKEACAGPSNLKRSKGRHIERSEYEDYVEQNIERVKLNKALYRQRQAIVEHPFGTIKRAWGYTYTLLRGKEKVSAEMALIFTCYNLRRSMSIFGVKDLIERLKEAISSMINPKQPFTSPSKPFSLKPQKIKSQSFPQSKSLKTQQYALNSLYLIAA